MIAAMIAALMTVQAGDVPSESAASAAWSACAERAAPFVARLDESVEAATEIAVSLCATESLNMSRAIDARARSPQLAAQDMAFRRELAGVRAKIRIVLERACPAGDVPCEAFFAINNGMHR